MDNSATQATAHDRQREMSINETSTISYLASALAEHRSAFNKIESVLETMSSDFKDFSSSAFTQLSNQSATLREHETCLHEIEKSITKQNQLSTEFQAFQVEVMQQLESIRVSLQGFDRDRDNQSAQLFRRIIRVEAMLSNVNGSLSSIMEDTAAAEMRILSRFVSLLVGFHHAIFISLTNCTIESIALRTR